MRWRNITPFSIEVEDFLKEDPGNLQLMSENLHFTKAEINKWVRGSQTPLPFTQAAVYEFINKNRKNGVKLFMTNL
jgi:hypothetical protein